MGVTDVPATPAELDTSLALIYYGSLGPGAGYVNSVIADYFTPLPDEIFGPYFEDVNAGLFYYAESVSP